MKVTLDHIDQLAPTIKTFWFRPDRSVRYEAGQFIQLQIPHENADERGEKRWFTLSSSPSEELLSITTRTFDEKSSTFKQLLFAAKPGLKLDMSDPMGDFVLPKDTTIPLLFVAGGIGITPMRSMLKWLHDTAEKRDVQLIYAVGNVENAVFTDLFNEYGLKFTLLPSNPPENWKGSHGLLTPELIQQLTPDIAGRLTYLSGPEPMVEALFSGLKTAGISDKKLVTDYFPGYTGI